MKNIIKKNQIVIFTIAIMLVAAGYMNYTMNVENSLETSKYIDTEKYAEIGDARLVSSSNVETNIVNNEKEENIVNNEENSNKTNNTVVENNVEQTSASTVTNSSDYFIQSKLDRENMYSQQIEIYQKLLANAESSETQKGIAQEEIQKINNQKNAIMITENLIKNKGFENVIIFTNDSSVNVIVKAENLTTEQIAQVQNIIQRELKAETINIHVSIKK